jgi:RNA polymerase sigma factor (sigma-70 family)
MASTSNTATAMSAWPDEALLARTRTGDERAFGELYQRHVAAARAAARCLVSAADVDDVVADAFANIFSIIQRGGGPEVAFRPYLLVCVRNTCYRLSSRRPVPRDPLDSGFDGPSTDADPLTAVVESSVVAKAFFSLPERWQQVLWQTEVEGRRPSELSNELGLSPGAVAALSFRAREGLSQAYLEAYLPARRSSGTCTTVAALLPPYVRNRVSAAERQAVGAHLEQCASCTSTLDDLEAANRPLRSLLGPAVLGASGSAYVARLFGGAARTIRRLATIKALGAAAATAVAIGATSMIPAPTGISPAIPAAAASPAAPPTGTVPSGGGTSSGASSLHPPGPPAGPPASIETSAASPAAGDLLAIAPVAATTVATLDAPPPAGAATPDSTAVGDPGVTVPAVTVPPVSVPPVTVPPLTLPPISTPDVSVGPITVPGIELPGVTLPEITVPQVTIPAITLPPVTLPPVTLPPPATTATTAPPSGGGTSIDISLGGIGVHLGLSTPTTAAPSGG